MAPHMGSGSEPARPCGMVGLQAFLYLRLQCEPSLILTAGLGKGRTGEGGREGGTAASHFFPTTGHGDGGDTVTQAS